MEVVLTRLRDFSCKEASFEDYRAAVIFREKPLTEETCRDHDRAGRLDIESALAWLRRELVRSDKFQSGVICELETSGKWRDEYPWGLYLCLIANIGGKSFTFFAVDCNYLPNYYSCICYVDVRARLETALWIWRKNHFQLKTFFRFISLNPTLVSIHMQCCKLYPARTWRMAVIRWTKLHLWGGLSIL